MVDDAHWMRRAIVHAERGLGTTTPNPVVGCCIVTPDGVVVGDGAHERAGGPHAEVNALEEAGDGARGATLYCTLEPCVHVGRTGPCTERIIAAGVARVVAAVEDPDPRVQGRGFDALRARGVEVVVGVERERAERLNRAYLMASRHGRPWVVMKTAMSADGHVSAAPGFRTPLTGSVARRHAQLVRAQVDAIGIGSGTLLVDDPWLTVRDVYRARPLTRVVFDRRLRTPLSAQLLTTRDTGPIVIVTSAAMASEEPAYVRTLESIGAQVVAPEEPGLLPALRALAGLDVHSLLLEGGPTLHRAALDEGLIDQVHIYVSPAVVGVDGVRWLPGLDRPIPEMLSLTVRSMGRDVFLEGYVHRTH